jgi:cell division protein FtsZ
VLSGRREANGHASVSAGHHSAAPGAAPGYQPAAAAQPGLAASQGSSAGPPDGTDSPLNGRNGHAPAPAEAGAAGQPDSGVASAPGDAPAPQDPPAPRDAPAPGDAQAPGDVPAAEPDPQPAAVPGRLDPVAAARVFDVASTRRRPVVVEEDDELDVPDFLK